MIKLMSKSKRPVQIRLLSRLTYPCLIMMSILSAPIDFSQNFDNGGSRRYKEDLQGLVTFIVREYLVHFQETFWGIARGS